MYVLVANWGWAVQAWSKEVREDMKKAYIKIVEDIQVHVKQLAFSERAMLLLVRPPPGLITNTVVSNAAAGWSDFVAAS